ncbi:MAG TPA: Hpt domain-containing protein [Frankiaceae bacterium]|nr:Hpt domain-containing protein [Frankiaceae bacterium]
MNESSSPTSAARAPETPIDPDVIDSLRGLGQRSGRNVLAELTSLFLTTADGQVNAARALLARGDVGELARVAHSLKGSGSVIGARRIAAAAAALEVVCTDGDATPGALSRARDGFTRVLAELELFRSAVGELDTST